MPRSSLSKGKTAWRLLLVLMLGILLLCNIAQAAIPNIDAVADSIKSLHPDYSHQVKLQDVTIDRGGARFVFDDGTLTFANRVFDRTLGGVFVGKGRFIFKPPNRAEEYMLSRHTQDSTAIWEFDSVAFIFSDSTMHELSGVGKIESEVNARADSKYLRDFINYVEDDMEMSVPALLLSDLVNPQFGSRFYARFTCRAGKMIFMYDPREVEEIQIYKEQRGAEGSYPDLIQSAHSSNQYAKSVWGPDRENKDLIDSLDYDIDCRIFQSAKTELAISCSFVSKVDSLSAIFFTLMPEIERQSLVVRDSHGDSLSTLRIKDEWGVTVFLSQPLNVGEKETLRFTYSSDRMVLKTPWGGNILAYASTWYPRYGYLKRARHKMTFSVPKQYEFVAVGNKVSEKIEGDFKICCYDVSDYPVAFVSYNYGPFEIDSTVFEDSIPVIVYGGTGHRPSMARMRRAVLLDVQTSAALFSAEVHPYPFKQLIATEIPSSHGQGFPGLLHLGYATFDNGLVDGFDDAFRAHEVAHQWWGHIVGWKTYHDQWLSEAFAEYFSGWYIQRKYADHPKLRGRFYDLLDQWRDDVFEKGSFTNQGYQTDYQEGNDAGPIWMGYRLASSRSSDYSTLVYSKGAYVLYMLRMMMFDFGRKSDAKFRAMLDDFLTKYKWSEATTADFQRVAEKHYGSSLQWFFDQWVYDTQLPEYRWKTDIRTQEDGKYAVDITVTASNVRDGFRMIIPFTIIMEGNYHTTTRLDVDQPEKTITVSNLPYKPEKFVFNSFKSVLCREKSN